MDESLSAILTLLQSDLNCDFYTLLFEKIFGVCIDILISNLRQYNHRAMWCEKFDIINVQTTFHRLQCNFHSASSKIFPLVPPKPLNQVTKSRFACGETADERQVNRLHYPPTSTHAETDARLENAKTNPFTCSDHVAEEKPAGLCNLLRRVQGAKERCIRHSVITAAVMKPRLVKEEIFLRQTGKNRLRYSAEKWNITKPQPKYSAERISKSEYRFDVSDIHGLIALQIGRRFSAGTFSCTICLQYRENQCERKRQFIVLQSHFWRKKSLSGASAKIDSALANRSRPPWNKH